jgi:hypothetical protein
LRVGGTVRVVMPDPHDPGGLPKTRIMSRQRAVQRADPPREAAILATPSRARGVDAG